MWATRHVFVRVHAPHVGLAGPVAIINVVQRALARAGIDSPFSHLETERGNDARTRNTRLAAIRSFFRFVALQEPRHVALAQRVLAIPDKRYTRRPVAWLERHEIEALLEAPDPRTRNGRRDRTLLLVAVQTGLRASELTGLRCEDVQFGAGAHVRCHGKGRKERCTPLRKDTAKALRAWLTERRGEPHDPVFPNQRGGPMNLDSLGYLLSKHVATARARCPRSPGNASVLTHCAIRAPWNLYGRLPERKDRFRCDGQADCSFVSGLLMRGLLPAGPDGICRSAPHFLRGLFAPGSIQAWRIAV